MSASFAGPRYPKTSDGNLVIFDASPGANVSWVAHPNQGNHLGSLMPLEKLEAAAVAGVSPWKWQASPWDSWNLSCMHNSFSPVLVPGASSDELLMYHNDESQHAGVHRWRISGLDSVVQLTPEQVQAQVHAHV